MTKIKLTIARSSLLNIVTIRSTTGEMRKPSEPMTSGCHAASGFTTLVPKKVSSFT